MTDPSTRAREILQAEWEKAHSQYLTQEIAIGAIDTAISDERARVVAWHRSCAVKLQIEMQGENEWAANWISLREQAETHEEAADAIERGEHLDG